MQVPPYPLWRLEAALAPMPLTYLELAIEEPKSDTKGDEVNTEEGEREEHELEETRLKRQQLMENPVKLEAPGDEVGGDMKSEVPGVALPSLEEALADESGIASAALLRDIHLGMLAVLDGSAAKNTSGTPQPNSSQPGALEGSGPYWPERVHDVLNKSSYRWAEQFPVLPDAMKVRLEFRRTVIFPCIIVRGRKVNVTAQHNIGRVFSCPCEYSVPAGWHLLFHHDRAAPGHSTSASFFGHEAGWPRSDNALLIRALNTYNESCSCLWLVVGVG
jgi:hypothetical protein